MGRDPVFLAVAAAVLLVALILALGIGNFAKGGDARKSNKLMQWRIIAQFGAVILIVLFVLMRRGG
ncbi:twin transmembrane helix small protein [Pseudooceanicola sediminis]|uniref:Twin transmembrane helix small protein n=1 Tax=Pseudooceanicola sediminis TaxID=2211117 RepID=A0A399J1V4_9RHOB|nr:twin transmembrane helix small protein [Pseudooceanicola sediminis]KAA2314912.1 twin transmembrane helix small protein [Puniceibacterium sp. HSS470]RII36936.1 twin transmembrane helix small protein [Pseudooceanicola sediminis]|tara:strand:+ start:7766 stop:7963 length:198 start_codon:yes stop_codon:yes gene_type:complete